MKEAILDKLGILFEKGVHDEAHVVYLLIEAHKLIEKEKKQDSYKVVGFYRDWAAHPELTRRPAQIFIEEIEQIYHSSPEVDFLKNIFDIISFQRLRTELKEFAQEYEISADLFKNHLWLEFCRLLLSVLEDCALVGRPAESEIEAFILRSGFSEMTVTCEINFKDGKNYNGTTNFGHFW
jgi:hypothetical protein